MDLEKIKKNYKWDPSQGDYPKSHLSHEKKVLRRKQIRNTVLVVLYIVLLIAAVIFVYSNIE